MGRESEREDRKINGRWRNMKKGEAYNNVMVKERRSEKREKEGTKREDRRASERKEETG